MADISAIEQAAGANNGQVAQFTVNSQTGTVTPLGASQPVAASYVAPVVVGDPAPDLTGQPGSEAPVDLGPPSSVDASGQTQNIQATLLDNPLDAYTSYTYGLSLHILTQNDYKSMITDGVKWRPTHTLIANGGNGQSRHTYWHDNFFFEDLKMQSTIAMVDTSRNTNVAELSFTIIEPMGLSFIDRLIRTVQDLNEPDYISCCYVLQIDFMDSETGLLDGHSKYIPFRILDMRIKATAKGSEYSISGFPFGHGAFLQAEASTPVRMSVTAKTLQEFFAKDTDVPPGIINAAVEAAKDIIATQQKASTATSGSTQPGARTVTDSTKVTDQYYEVKSYVSAYNKWYQKLVDLKAAEHAGTIEVLFHDDILKKQDLTNTSETPGQGAMADPKKVQSGMNVQPNSSGSKYTWKFEAGAYVTEVINQAMMSSAFIRDQVNISTSGSTTNKTGKVRWWKIVTQLQLGDYDKVTSSWTYHTKYVVIPYEMWNTKHENLPIQSPIRNDCVKEYQYLYTGKNKSVLDLQMEFDFLYFTKVTAIREQNPENAKGTVEPVDAAGTPKTPIATICKNVIKKIAGDPAVAGTGAGGSDAIQQALISASQSVYSTQLGDMLNVKMKIIGDPHLIKQDDLFMNAGIFMSPNKAPGSDGIVTPVDYRNASATLSNNSLIMDASEVLVWVEFKVPVDMDELTGYPREDYSGYSTSAFTGVYKIFTIESEFKSGAFTQTLELTRYLEQVQDTASSGNVTLSETNKNIIDTITRKPVSSPNSDVKQTSSVNTGSAPLFTINGSAGGSNPDNANTRA